MHLAMLIFIDWQQLQRNDNGRASAQGGVELIHISKKHLLYHSAQPTLKLFTWTCVQLHCHRCPSDPDDKRSNDTQAVQLAMGNRTHTASATPVYAFFLVSFGFISFFFFQL